MNRREFLSRSGINLGAFVASPQLGVLTAIATAVGFSKKTVAEENISEFAGINTQLKSPLLRTGEPLTTQGLPFGSKITSIALVELPSASQPRKLLIAGHGDAHGGHSVAELVRDEKRGWIHDISTAQNRRRKGDARTVLEGVRLRENASAYRFQETRDGIGAVHSMVALPTHTVLLAGDWISELNPRTGFVAKRLCLGRTLARAICPIFISGLPIEIYFIGGEPGTQRFYKFVGHQIWNQKNIPAYSELLKIGELYAADLASSTWVSLTRGASDGKWVQILDDPSRASALPTPVGYSIAEWNKTIADLPGLAPKVRFQESDEISPLVLDENTFISVERLALEEEASVIFRNERSVQRRRLART